MERSEIKIVFMIIFSPLEREENLWAQKKSRFYGVN